MKRNKEPKYPKVFKVKGFINNNISSHNKNNNNKNKKNGNKSNFKRN
jgi:hypothetical protein